jgi:cell division protein FtsA
MAERMVVGIDVGTSKVAVLVATADLEGSLSVLAGAQVPAQGMRQGVVVNIEEVTGSIASALERVERLSGQQVSAAVVSLAGRHLTATNRRGTVALTPGGREVQYDDVVRAIEAARAGSVPGDNREMVHQLPRGYTVDDQEGVPNPIGMAGFQLEVETHIVTGSSTTIQNLIKCVRAAEVEPDDLVSAPLAAAGAVLTPAERVMGTLVVDMGGGTTSVALVAQGFPWYSAELPGGGESLTYAIAAGLRLPLEVAEHLKLTYGHCDPLRIADDDLIELGDGSLVLPQSELARVILTQARELVAPLRLPVQQAHQAGLRPMGVVLTGGTAQLPGLRELVERTLGLPVRIGAPRDLRGVVDGLSGPSFATVVGLLLWGAQRTDGMRLLSSGRKRSFHTGQLTTRLRRVLQAFLP